MDPIVYDIYPLGHTFGSAVSSKVLFVRRPKKLFTYYCLVASVWLTSTEEPTASGWSQLPSTPATSGGITLRLYTRIVTATDPFIYEWRLTDNEADWYCVIDTYHGVDITTPVSFSHSQAQSSPSATLPTGTITTTTDKCLIIASYLSYEDHEILPASGFRETAQKSFTTRRIQVSAHLQSEAGLIQAIASFKEGTAASLNNIAALNPLVIEEKTKDIYPPSVEGYWQQLGEGDPTWSDHPAALVTRDGYQLANPGHPEDGIVRYTVKPYMEFDLSEAIDVPSAWTLQLTDALFYIKVAPGLGVVQDSCNPGITDHAVGFKASAKGAGDETAIGLTSIARVYQHENGTRKTYGVPVLAIMSALNTPLGPLQLFMESEECPCQPQGPYWGGTVRMIGWSGTASGIGGPMLELKYVLVPPYMPLKDGGYQDLPPPIRSPNRLWFSNRTDGTLTIGCSDGILKYPNLEGEHRFEEKVTLDGESTGVGQSLDLLVNLDFAQDPDARVILWDALLEYLASSRDGEGTMTVELLTLARSAFKTFHIPVEGGSASLQLPKLGARPGVLLRFGLDAKESLNVQDLALLPVTFRRALRQEIGTK
jgi:hypothetical protein